MFLQETQIGGCAIYLISIFAYYLRRLRISRDLRTILGFVRIFGDLCILRDFLDFPISCDLCNVYEYCVICLLCVICVFYNLPFLKQIWKRKLSSDELWNGRQHH